MALVPILPIPKSIRPRLSFTPIRPCHLLALFALVICYFITFTMLLFWTQRSSPQPPQLQQVSLVTSTSPCWSIIGSKEEVSTSNKVDFNFTHDFIPTPGWTGTIDLYWNPELLSTMQRVHGEFSLEWFQLNGTWLEMGNISAFHRNVKAGGIWSPASKEVPRPQVAIIIKYRDRLNHLKVLLDVLHTFLQRQKINYRIFVAEQYGNYSFNRGALPNAAFITAMTLAKTKFNCFIFHDVDLVPENLENLYNCDKSPQHLAAAVDKFDYRLPYRQSFGGVVAFTPAHFLWINGYPNTYWGWGGEDDDLYYRTKNSSLVVTRLPSSVARYKMLSHQSEWRLPTKRVCDLLRTAATRWPLDGLSTLQFRLLFIENKHLYTHLMIDVGLPPDQNV